MTDKVPQPSEEETLRNAAKICIALLKATPFDLVEGTGGKARCPGKVRVPKGWGWMPCSNYLERGDSLCPGPCLTTWGPR